MNLNFFMVILLLGITSSYLYSTRKSDIDLILQDFGINFLQEKSVKGKNGAVASDSPECSKVGTDILQKHGGNAVDAAVATLFCLGTIRPFASGLGGGGGMLISVTGKPMEYVDFREEAPLSARHNMFENATKGLVKNFQTMAVPGELKGLWYAQQKFGKIKWATVIEPSLIFARDGWKVEPLLEARCYSRRRQILKGTGGLGRVFAPNGILLKTGDLVKRPAFAETLKKISETGTSCLYTKTGKIVNKLLNELKQVEGAPLCLADFENYTLKIKKPHVSTYREFKIVTGAVPSSGPVINLMLNILEGFDLSKRGPNDAATHHLIIEALKHGFAHRNILGDPDFVDISDLLNNMTDKTYAKSLFKKIDISKTFDNEHYLVNKEEGNSRDKGTSHISIIDKEGNAVSATSSINHSFGSKFMSKSTGLIINDQMNDFTKKNKVKRKNTLEQSIRNQIKTGKRPVSSMSPTLIFDKTTNKIKLSIGSSGGPTIISSLLHIIISILDWKMDPKFAIDRSRYHAMLNRNIYIEDGFDVKLVNELGNYGHRYRYLSKLRFGISSAGIVQAVLKKNDWFLAASDRRKKGKASAF